jgi:hypothetical protein
MKLALQQLHHLPPIEEQANNDEPCIIPHLLIGQLSIHVIIFEVIPGQDRSYGGSSCNTTVQSERQSPLSPIASSQPPPTDDG